MTKKTSASQLSIPGKHAFLASGQTYVLPKGKVGQRDQFKRLYLCWQKDTNWIYYTCVSCKAITRSTVHLKPVPGTYEKSGLFMDKDVVGTYGCEYCTKCSVHHWFVLEDFPVKAIQKKIAKNPGQCLMCKSKHILDNCGFLYCERCTFHWRLPVIPVQTGVTHVDKGG